jgi:hypothetical protein
MDPMLRAILCGAALIVLLPGAAGERFSRGRPGASGGRLDHGPTAVRAGPTGFLALVFFTAACAAAMMRLRTARRQ